MKILAVNARNFALRNAFDRKTPEIRIGKTGNIRKTEDDYGRHDRVGKRTT